MLDRTKVRLFLRRHMRQAAFDESDITEEMAQAGEAAYDEWADSAPSYLLVLKIYSAMACLEPDRNVCARSAGVLLRSGASKGA